MTPIAEWLKTARLSQLNPDTGRPWSQEYLAARVTAETGWKLYREMYVGYERGAGMQPETLQHFIDFWSRYGVEPPDMTPPAPERSLEERAVLAAERQAVAMELMAARLDAAERRADALEALVATLTAPTLADPQAVEAMRSWGHDALARSRTRAQRPDLLRVTE